MRFTDPGGIPSALPPYLQPPVAAAPYYPPPDAVVGNAGGDLGGQFSGVTPPPIPGGGGGGGGSTLAQVIHAMRSGYTPDYQALLASDPQLLQAQADVRGTLGGAAATRKAATAKILAQLGIVPDFASGLNALGLNSSYLGADVDPTVQGLAQTMTDQGLSTEAQLNRQHDVGVNSLVDALAARGVLRSGGLGVGLTSENQRDKQAHFDALRAALDAIGGAQGGYNQTVQDTAATLRGETENAVQRQIQLHPAVAGSQVDASYDATTGLYKDSDGNFYNADGTSTKPGASNASPVHPSNVAPPTAATESATAATFPQAAAQTAVPTALPNQGAGPYIGSANAPQYPPPVPKATIPSAPLPNQGAGPYIGSQNAPTYTAPAPTPVPAATPTPATAWSNSVTKRLNMGF